MKMPTRIVNPDSGNMGQVGEERARKKPPIDGVVEKRLETFARRERKTLLVCYTVLKGRGTATLWRFRVKSLSEFFLDTFKGKI